MSWKDKFPKNNIYYQTENGILYNGDCVDIMAQFPEESIDLILTDPPYNISQEGNKIVRNKKHYKWRAKTDISLDFGKWDRDWSSDKEFLLWTEEWFSEFSAIAKQQAWFFIFFNKQKTGYFDLFLGPKYGIKARTIYVWCKTNPVPSFRKVNFNSATEVAWVGSKGGSKLKNFKEQKYMSNYFLSPNASAYKKTTHPTEKPITLFTHLVEVASNENDIVLDSFMGSGTTAIACERTHRKWIGIEKNKNYCEIIKSRVNDYTKQTKLNLGV